MTKKEIKQAEKEKYGCTKAMYEGRIRSAVRKIWMYSKGRKDALIRSRTHASTDVSFKYHEHCERCNNALRIGAKEYTIKKNGERSKKKRPCLVVHHIEPVPSVFDPNFLINMYCEQYDNPADGYLVVCHDCHEEEHRKLDEEQNGNEGVERTKNVFQMP